MKRWAGFLSLSTCDDQSIRKSHTLELHKSTIGQWTGSQTIYMRTGRCVYHAGMCCFHILGPVAILSHCLHTERARPSVFGSTCRKMSSKMSNDSITPCLLVVRGVSTAMRTADFRRAVPCVIQKLLSRVGIVRA